MVAQMQEVTYAPQMRIVYDENVQLCSYDEKRPSLKKVVFTRIPVSLEIMPSANPLKPSSKAGMFFLTWNAIAEGLQMYGIFNPSMAPSDIINNLMHTVNVIKYGTPDEEAFSDILVWNLGENGLSQIKIKLEKTQRYGCPVVRFYRMAL